ncbi:Calcium uptake protein 1 homolog, mitochondrial-like Protein [Tribolium castaneum]|uniref:Calcium uptake protein 1 homolog, mitochondrial-like Protein n=1 Tax=Tribolium castaneum TaxID=7070 RepID=D6WQH5_TRICA|nr:Calcium uptake protein 1 homolog, mitochondrial-like Protein [Tribolium castaneum]
MSSWQNLVHKLRKNWKQFQPNLKSVRNVKTRASLTFCAIGGATYWYFFYSKEPKKSITRNYSQQTFLKFATVEYKGQIYMTPSDFLSSVIELNPKMRRNRRAKLTERQIQYIRARIPPQTKQFFSKLQNNGIISYTEYLFLLSLLIKPAADIEIAFKMLDTDYNGVIDKEEFLVMETIFSRSWRQKLATRYETGLENKLDTTLAIYFFGSDGTKVLSYQSFKLFVTNLQEEILQLEFSQFAHGTFINDIDFAKLLVRYTYFDNYDNYIERLLATAEREPSRDQLITFEEFHSFMGFLHRLEDFYFATRYYAEEDSQITRKGFHDILKLLGRHDLTWHMIETVFNIFDVDGTGYVNYRDLFMVLNDRLNRGLTRHVEKSEWQEFKSCLRRAINPNPGLAPHTRRKQMNK